MRWVIGSWRQLLISMCILLLVTACPRKPADELRDIQTIIEGFNERRFAAIGALIDAEIPEDVCSGFLSNQIKAQAILYQAEHTKDYSRIKEANDRLLNFCRRLDEPESEWWRRTNHGGAMIVMRILLRYADRPDLLFPETVAKIKDGKEPDGKIIPEESLRYYIPIICYNEKFHIGFYRWKVPFENAWEYTENHRLQLTVHALLICQIYGAECYAPPDGPTLPLRSTEKGAADYWGYWKGAFYDYLIGYSKPRYPIEPWQFGKFRHMDWGITEKDGATYTHVFMGDFWLLRDVIDDPIMAKYSELFIDLLLADYAEEAVRGIFVGAHENSEKHSFRLPGLLHIFNHLLFADLAFVPPARDYFDWGAWAYTSVLTSDYNPIHPDFPRVILDVAVNKPAEGYMVTEAVAETEDGLPGKPKATWIKPDYALGFGIESWIGWGYHGGGVYVATHGESLENAGLAILPFGMDDNNHFDLKYSRICPIYSVVGKGVAITQCGTEQLPAKIWIKDGFIENFTTKPPWLFFTAGTSLDRAVYIAIRPVLSGYQIDQPRTPGAIVPLPGDDVPEWAFSTVPFNIGGKIIKFDNPADYLIWEVSDEDALPTFEDFKRAIVNNELTVTNSIISYTSCENIRLTFHRQNPRQSSVNSERIDLDHYRYVIKNPWMDWKQNEQKAYFRRGSNSAFYDFDPDGDGIFMDEMPVKTIENSGIP
jgi:hypothetical protein